ncbi:LPD29 domain-containing protein [Gluconobacter albidus]|uniref:LPD29 domain-containing protein n=2 Tax=Gluconobacter TaxID=441 RepID=UPI000AA28431|nr:LPD29 domain-containing protein [Gluconobacter albidus]
MSEEPTVTVGTRVSTILYNRGRGVVSAVHGTPRPETIRRLAGGFIAAGGNASFDIVFACGSISKKLPESILHGVQWTIFHDEPKAGPEEIAQLRAHAEACRAEKQARKEQAEAEHAAEIERLRVDPEHAHLEQGSDQSGVLAGKNIRRLLKAALPHHTFRVRKSSYGSVSISCNDPLDDAAQETVSDIRKRFRSGLYDQVTDCHSKSRSPWQEVFGSAEYVF